MASVVPASSTQIGTQPGNHTASNWSFINNSGPNDHEEARRLIRANAMRDYWRRKKDRKVEDANGTLLDRKTATERDQIPVNKLVLDETSNVAWRVRDIPPASAERKKRHAKLRERPLAELAIEKADQRSLFTVDDARIIYEKRKKDAGSKSGVTHADLPRSLGVGVIDPFNALPIGGSSEHNSFVLSHCKLPLSLSLSGLVHTPIGNVSANLMTKLFRLSWKTSRLLSPRVNVKLS